MNHLETISRFWNKMKTSNKFENNLEKIKKYEEIIWKTTGRTSNISLLRNADKYIIKKTYRNEKKNFCNIPRPLSPRDCFLSEVEALVALSGKTHFPQIFCYDAETLSIFMSYCGKSIGDNNGKMQISVPKNWREQLMEIYQTLRTHHIYNNDIHLGNFCLKNGVISLIDFGFAKNHLDFCYQNMSLHDIRYSHNIKELCDQIKKRRNVIHESIYFLNEDD